MKTKSQRTATGQRRGAPVWLQANSATIATEGLSPDEEQTTMPRRHAMRIKTHVKAGFTLPGNP
jgi:hypothetical protein